MSADKPHGHNTTSHQYESSGGRREDTPDVTSPQQVHTASGHESVSTGQADGAGSTSGVSDQKIANMTDQAVHDPNTDTRSSSEKKVDQTLTRAGVHGGRSAIAGGAMSPAAMASGAMAKTGGLLTQGLKGLLRGGFGTISKAVAMGAKIGLSTTATATILGIGATGALAGGIGWLNNNNVILQQQLADDEDDDFECGPTQAQEVAAFGNADDQVSADREAERRRTAREIYDILKPMGTSNENIAGILGAWDVESMLDPTTVETIYDEPYRVGPKKKAAEAKGFKASLVAPEYKARFPGVDVMGVGIAQISNSRGKQLQDFAKSQGKSWADMGANLAYFIGHDDPADKKYFRSMIENQNEGKNSPAEASAEITRKWERPAESAANYPKRAELAEKWFAEMASWGPGNPSLSQSVLAQANTTVQSAAVNEVQNASIGCAQNVSQAGLGNASAAQAMADYAWPTRAQSMHNNGTSLYQYLHKEILPGDGIYMSCDRSVAVGVRWSDTDPGFPAGPTIEQYKHMVSSPLWEKVEWGAKKENLRPGDIFIKGGSGGSGHIVMFLGEEIAKSKPGTKPGSNIAHGSLGSRSPGIDTYSQGYLGSGKFEVYRRTATPTEGKYKDIPVPADVRGN